MKPVSFKEQTKILQRPPTMPAEQCIPLPVYTDGTVCINCWKLSLMERLMAAIWGRVWLSVLSGSTQPPVWLDCQRLEFEYQKEDK